MSGRPTEDSIQGRDAIKDCEFDKFTKSSENKRVVRVVAGDDLPVIFSGAKNTKVTIVNVANSGTKTTFNFQDGVKSFTIRSEKVTEIKYNFDEADYDANKKATITSGGFLKLSGLDLTGGKIFFDTDKNNVDIEILELY